MSEVKKILISQKRPLNVSQYAALSEKFGVEIDFRPFYLIEPLTSKEFRAQKVNIQDYTAIVFSSRHAIDAFFRICDELRYKVPETMKYFCTTEAVAMYLQKHIVYRKRKVFYGQGSAESVTALVGTRHKGEKFLIAVSDANKNDSLVKHFTGENLDCRAAAFIKPVPQDLHDVDIHSYDLAVFFNPSDVVSLRTAFPDFKQDGLKFITFGKSIVKAMEDDGLEIEMKAPLPEAPSVARAIELYLEKNQEPH